MLLKASARYRRTIGQLPLLAIFATALMGVYLLPVRSWFAHKADRIRTLQELPLGPVHLEGVVTYVDGRGKRFWIQDETGALAIEQDPATSGVRPKQVVRVEAQKTQPYNPAIGLASVQLQNLRIKPTKQFRTLPAAVPATLLTLPEVEKNGTRVEVKGVLHSVARDQSGRLRIALGESAKEVWAEAPITQEDLSGWINRSITLVGVNETGTDQNGSPSAGRLLVQDWEDVHLEGTNSPAVRLYSVRGLYNSTEVQNGHAVRIRVQLVKRLSASSWLMEDSWGAIACNFDVVPGQDPGRDFEITGFPVMVGSWSREIDLYHATAIVIGPQQARESFHNEEKPAPLTTLGELRELSSAKASQALPVRIVGVITSTAAAFRKTIFVQDSTAGVYVQFSGTPAPLLAGEKITIIGLSGQGTYTPEIVAPKFTLHGKGIPPKAIELTAQNAFTGMLTSEVVQLVGVIHSVKPDSKPSPVHYFDLHSSLGPIRVGSRLEQGYLASLQDATVRMRGVYIPLHNIRRQLTGLWVLVTNPGDIQVLEPPDPHPFRKEALPINQLLFFSPHGRFNHRVKVSGTVTVVGPGFFYIQDEGGGLQVLGDTRDLRPGDVAEVAGYAAPGAYSPVLTDAIARVLQHDAVVHIQQASADALAGGEADSQLVSLQGRLLGLTTLPKSTTLVIQSGGRTFNATLYSTNVESERALEPGSIIQLTGISSVQAEFNNTDTLLHPAGFKFVIRSPQDIQVLKPPPWWNVKHTAILLVVLLSTILGAFLWVSRLRRRVRRQNAALEEAMAKAMAFEEMANTMDTVAQRKDFTARVLVRGKDEISRLGVQFNKMLAELHTRDVAKAEAESKLQLQALTDELTGLPNRRLLFDRLVQTLAGAQRSRRIVALVYIDLDGFKLVNDSLGHSFGDVLLGQVAERLRSRIREADTLARLGGDEFTIVLTQLHRKEEAELVAKNLLEVLSKPFLLDGHEINVSASVGISLFPENSTTAAELLQQADSAMYAAKRNGKNRLMYFTPALSLMVRERLSLENHLRGAISRGEMVVHYQPEFDVVSQKLVCFEALARWTHPTLGSVPPSKFIPIAEECGLIVPLGAYILERACEEAAKWQKISTEPVQVAVNVSNIQFARDTFVEEVIEVLRHTGLNPNLLQIELTESVMLNGIEAAADTMRRLGARGISVAIDDFGTGYSCFGYLPRLPFNTLKIDRTFVRELGTRVEMKAMIQSLVTLAHNLNMQVVVEGIETTLQLEMIKALGGNQVQGDLLGRPTPDPSAQLRKRERLHLAAQVR